MLNRIQKSRLGLFCLLLLISLLSINLIAALLLGSAKGDLTDNRRYSLSPASREIINSLTAPVYIRVYLSSGLAKENPQYANYATFVLRFLKKYQDLAGTDKIRLEIKTPEPYSNVETEAKEQGLKPFLDNSGQSNLYFGAVFSNDIGENYVVPLFLEERSGWLETDISRILSKMNADSRPTIGLVSPQLPLVNRQYGKVTPNWAIVAQLQNDYNVVEISDQLPQIPTNIDALMIVNPRKLAPLFAYALDQYVIRGGKILLILDAYAEKQAQLFGSQNSGVGDYNRLLKNWGVTFNSNKVAGDSSLGELMLVNSANGQQYKNYPFWLMLTEQQINQQHPLTAGLRQIRIKSPGIIAVSEKSENTEITPLFHTSATGGSTESPVLSLNDKNEIASQFKSEEKTHNLAVAVKGNFDSLFTGNPLKSTSLAPAMLSFLPHSIAEGEIIIVADSDLIVAENWADTSQTVGNPVYGTVPFFDNGSFLLKSLDYLTGRKNVLGLQNKSSSGNLQSIGENVYNQIFNNYAEEYNRLQFDLQNKQAEQAEIEQKLAAKQLSLSADVVQQIEQNRTDIRQLQEKMKYIEYRIKQDNADRLNGIIMINLIFIPLLIIFGLALGVWVLRRRSQRKVKEMFDESSHA